jgi:dehydrogenase/reductase SDR family protein 7B
MGTLTGKVVWITGASSGIGAALAVACRREGAHLVLSARRADALARVEASLPPAAGADAMVLPLDVTDIAAFGPAVAAVLSRFGRVDVLVNNAGVSQRSRAEKTPLEVDRRIMEVNFFGPVALTKAVLPSMLAAGGGRVVVVSSISGKFGYHLRSAYSASKHALHGYFESLRMELHARGLRVTVVCPGRIRTDISLHALLADGSEHRRMDAGQLNGRSAEDCAARILRGIARDEEEVLFGGREMLALWIRRFLPSLFSRMMRNRGPD